ncbi:hypothetical protein Hbl1158_15645 (plasmid) [Halobaculum sp. CBA1158]|nr:hypothetical protein [Halobaculum sp. CBA1158]UIP01344.1 hypothetical protein Hbl1158_15645 [Halobaculum sp. CBA1158]
MVQFLVERCDLLDLREFIGGLVDECGSLDGGIVRVRVESASLNTTS